MLSFSEFANYIVAEELRINNTKSAAVLCLFALFATLIANSTFRQWFGIFDLRVENAEYYCAYVEVRHNHEQYVTPALIEVDEEKLYIKKFYSLMAKL